MLYSFMINRVVREVGNIHLIGYLFYHRFTGTMWPPKSGSEKENMMIKARNTLIRRVAPTTGGRS